MKKFCKLCGTKLIEENTKYFDEETGEIVKTMVCPKVGCIKSCEFYGCELTKHLFKRNHCIKCGEVPYSEFI